MSVASPFRPYGRLAAIKRGLPLCREGFLQMLREPLRNAACCWKCGNEAGLQRVVDVDLAEKGIRLWLQRLVDLGAPAPVVTIDEIRRNKAPDPPVQHFIVGRAIDGTEKIGGANAFAARPPVSITNLRPAFPVKRVIEAAGFGIPAVGDGLPEKHLGSVRQPVGLPASELPE